MEVTIKLNIDVYTPFHVEVVEATAKPGSPGLSIGPSIDLDDLFGDVEETMNKIMGEDADGELGHIGEMGRVRLSALEVYGVSVEERNVRVSDLDEDSMRVEFADGNHKRIQSGDFRWGTDLKDANILDADNKVGRVHHSARLRLSRLEEHEVDEADRQGTIMGQQRDGCYTLTLNSGRNLHVEREDFRFN